MIDLLREAFGAFYTLGLHCIFFEFGLKVGGIVFYDTTVH